MPNYRKQSWSQVDMHVASEQDPLLSCLVLLTRYFNNPFSPQSLIARLPLQDNKLSVDLFERAANRASIKTNLIDFNLEHAHEDILPLVLLMKDGGAYLLVLYEQNKMAVINPLDPGNLLDIKGIKENYSGKAFTITNKYKHSKRAQDSLAHQPKNWFWSVVSKSWPIYSEVLVAAFLINLFALAMPLFTMNVYDRVVPNNAIITMWVLVSGIVCIFAFDVLLKGLRAHFIDLACKRSDLELSGRIFEQILGVDMSTRPKSVGAFANTVQSFEIFREFITSSTLTVFVDLPFTLIFIWVIYLLGGIIFLVPLIVIPLIILIGFLLQPPLISLTRESYRYSAEKQATLFDSLSNIEAVKTVGAESALQSRWERIVKLASANSMKLHLISNVSMNITILVQQIASIAVVIIGVYLIGEGQLTVGALIACTILAGRAIAPMAQVASLFTRYHQATNAMESLDKIMQLPTDVDEEVTYLHRPKLKGSIDFQHVNFHYQDATVPILKNINFKINPGDKIAVIGRIGSGKSTLAKLIMRLYSPTEGSILLDNTDYRQINPDELRQQIGYVPQDVSLFYGSIRENIIMGAPFVTDDLLLKACDVAGISAFTNNHPLGLDRPVGERGSELSGGQRQAVGIARSLLRDPKIILLDEPTASMDVNSEVAFKKRLMDYLTPEHTLILVTHKSSMLDLVDRIIILDDGKLVADGPKDGVLSALKAGVSVEKETS
jgi:ATP-binding cassette subfamily C protein LapB